MPRPRLLARLAAIAALTSVLGVASAHAADAPVPQQARDLMDHNHWKRARDLIEPEFKAHPNDAAVVSALAQVRLGFDRLDEARDLAELAVKIAPGDAQAHETCADVFGELAGHSGMLKAMGYARRFRKEAEASLAIEPGRFESLMGLMIFYLKAPGIAGGSRQKALQKAGEIAKFNPAKGELALARYAQETGDTNAVEGHYRAAIEKDPKCYEAMISLASAAAAPWRAQWEVSETQARAASKVAPDRSGPYALLASLYAHLERWGDLDQVLAEADAACPDDRNPWYQTGRILLAEGHDLARAERCFRHFLDLEPEPNGPALAHAHWRLGLVLEKQNHRAEAITEVEAALKLKPDLDPAKRDLKRLKG
jgi:tetratricopeptide (TPR) repeat protein